MNASNQTDTARTIDLAERALRDLAPASLLWRGMTQINLGIAYAARGEPRQAGDALHAGIQTARQIDARFLGLFGRMHLGNVRLMQGELRAAHAIFVHALVDAEAQNLECTPLAGYLYGGYGKLLYEWNELAESRVMLERARERIAAQARPWAAFDIEIDLSRVALAQDHAAQARAIFAALTELLENAKLEPLWRAFRAWQARMALRQGSDARAVEWADSSDASARQEIPLTRELTELTRARVWIRQGRTGEAKELLERIADFARAQGRDGAVIECEMLYALTFAREGNTARSFTHLQRALEMARAENFVRLFVDEGEPMRKMLGDWSANRSRFEEIGDLDLRDYAEKLLAAFGESSATVSSKSKIINQKSEMLVESLSERELQVLRLIASGASNQDIADKLVIALPTVKRHISNIYAKLQVTSRTQALVRARELKLI
jgi:LuxR family maltose regulon positive regulatory protein